LLSAGTLTSWYLQSLAEICLAPNTDKRASLTAALQTKPLQSICGVCAAKFSTLSPQPQVKYTRSLHRKHTMRTIDKNKTSLLCCASTPLRDDVFFFS